MENVRRKQCEQLRTICGRNEAPCEPTVRRLMTKFETTGSVSKVKWPGRKRSCRTEEQLILVQDSGTVSPGKSIRRRSQKLDIPTTSLHRIFVKISRCTRTKFNLRKILSQRIMGSGGDQVTRFWRDSQRITILRS